MQIQNALVYGEAGIFEKRNISVAEGRIASASADGKTVDATGCYLIPGLVDIHFHGCMGYDFCDGEPKALSVIAEYQAQNGITAICPATMTLPEETLVRVCQSAADYCAGKRCADLVGINLEGPFLSYEKRGAQNPDYLHLPDTALFRRLQEAAGGLIKLLDIAPELDGALELIEELRKEVVVSIAHTTADYDTAMQAIEKGAHHLTHLYNAMPAFTHRSPGVIGAGSDAHCTAELICDGIHVHPSAVRAAYRLFGEQNIILISDSMRATGLKDGIYDLGGQRVCVNGKVATLEQGGNIAGSVTNLMECLRTAVNEVGIPLETAVGCAAVNPAKAVGIFDRCGSITEGKIANLVLLDASLEVKQVILRGEALF